MLPASRHAHGAPPGCGGKEDSRMGKMKILISKHLEQIRRDFKLPDDAGISQDSHLRSYWREEIIEMPLVLDGFAKPYLRLVVYDAELVVEHRLKVMPENGNNHDLILRTRNY
jgi:hypothetical protein